MRSRGRSRPTAAPLRRGHGAPVCRRAAPSSEISRARRHHRRAPFRRHYAHRHGRPPGDRAHAPGRAPRVRRRPRRSARSGPACARSWRSRGGTPRRSRHRSNPRPARAGSCATPRHLHHAGSCLPSARHASSTHSRLSTQFACIVALMTPPVRTPRCTCRCDTGRSVHAGTHRPNRYRLTALL